MSDDFQAELRFLGIVSLPAFVRQPKGNGCIERFFRTLKEQAALGAVGYAAVDKRDPSARISNRSLCRTRSGRVKPIPS